MKKEKKIYPALYWVEVWDEYKRELVKYSGCTLSTSFTEAMSNIEEYYGRELCSVKMEMLEECNVVEFKTYNEAEKILKSY